MLSSLEIIAVDEKKFQGQPNSARPKASSNLAVRGNF